MRNPPEAIPVPIPASEEMYPGAVGAVAVPKLGVWATSLWRCAATIADLVASATFDDLCRMPLAKASMIDRPEKSVQPLPENGPFLAGENGSRSRALDSTPLTADVTFPAMFLMPLIRPRMIDFPALYSHEAAPETAPFTLLARPRIVEMTPEMAFDTADFTRLKPEEKNPTIEFTALDAMDLAELTIELMVDLMAPHTDEVIDFALFQMLDTTP